jgi:ABC transporter substrate binding protein
MSYGPSISDVHRQAAIYIDQILRGANPGELPIKQPMKFEFVINLKAAKTHRSYNSAQRVGEGGQGDSMILALRFWTRN